jgi:hypothetical protein
MRLVERNWCGVFDRELHRPLDTVSQAITGVTE